MSSLFIDDTSQRPCESYQTIYSPLLIPTIRNSDCSWSRSDVCVISYPVLAPPSVMVMMIGGLV